MLYNVSYDLDSEAGNYAEVEKVLCSLGQAVRCLQSTWFLQTEKSAAEVKSALYTVLGRGEYCLITEVVGTNNDYRLNAERGVNDWLEQRSIYVA